VPRVPTLKSFVFTTMPCLHQASWDGGALKKVGEGLCPRASDAAIRIGTAAIGKPSILHALWRDLQRAWRTNPHSRVSSHVACRQER
jgi:hypothetical protein